MNFLVRDFYMDDGLTSCDTVEEAQNLVKRARTVCSKANIHLHKFLSNNRQVMESIPPTERCQDMSTVELNFNDLPLERVLGVQWCIESDQFKFRLTFPEKPLTRRGILATVASVYDPLGCLAPFTLCGKQILQQLCRETPGWDESLSDELRPQWERWLADLPNLEKLMVARCCQPDNFGQVVSRQLHHFSDASTVGYGQCSYLRLVNSENETYCCLVMGKSRVAPSKITTVPRLELTAAVTSLKISKLLRAEMTYPDIEEYFWTDSKVVLGYIQNDARKFHVFVSNRVQTIRNSSRSDQWFYVPSSENPADHASRGLSATDLINSNWFSGPSFLRKLDLPLPQHVSDDISDEDPEVKRVVVHAAQTKDRSIVDSFEKFSDWQKVLRAIGLLKCRLQGKKGPTQQEDRRQAEITIWKLLQAESFPKELKLIEQNKTVPRGNRLEKLDPFIDKEGLLRVGGRL